AISRAVVRVNNLLAKGGIAERVEIQGEPLNHLPRSGIRPEEYLPGSEIFVSFLDASAWCRISISEKVTSGHDEESVAVGWWQRNEGSSSQATAVALRLDVNLNDMTGKWMFARITNLEAFHKYLSLEWEFVKEFRGHCASGVIEQDWNELNDRIMEEWIGSL